MRCLWFDFLRYFNDGEPSSQEIDWVLDKFFRHEAFELSDRIIDILIARDSGMSLEEIAQSRGLTRERVRQCLLKACRIARQL